jgi:adenylate cyclase
MGGLSASGLAELAGVTEAEVERLVTLGILVPRGGPDPFLDTDVQKVRLAAGCEQAGLPMAGIAAAIRAGRLSFAFLEAAPFRRWAVRSVRTYRQVSQETGVPLDTLGAVLESMGFARVGPDEPMREDELAVVPLLRLGLSSGTLDLAWLTRLGRAHAEGLRLIATAWGEAYQARFEGPALASGADQRTAMEQAAQKSVAFLPLSDPALLAIYHRQQELLWTEGLVERIEDELEAAGMLGRPGRVHAMAFLDLVGYTPLTEQHGDAAAAATAEALAVLVSRSARQHGGVPVKWLGDGVMVHYREPAGAVLSALELVAQLPEAGLPPAHVVGPSPGRPLRGGR